MAITLRLSPRKRAELTTIVRRQTAPARTVRRAKILLGLADGISRAQLSRDVGMTRQAIIDLEKRFAEGGLEVVLSDAQRPGRPPSIPEKTIAGIVEATLHTKPRHSTHWTARAMAAKFKVGVATVHRTWRDHELQPHKTEAFVLHRSRFCGESARCCRPLSQSSA